MPADEALALFPERARRICRLLQPVGRSRACSTGSRAVALEPLRVPERIALAITTRLEILAPWREAVRRALSVLALPQHAPLGLRLLYGTVDGIWYAAGDRATDFSFYTKARHACSGLCRHIAILARRPFAGLWRYTSLSRSSAR